MLVFLQKSEKLSVPSSFGWKSLRWIRSEASFEKVSIGIVDLLFLWRSLINHLCHPVWWHLWQTSRFLFRHAIWWEVKLSTVHTAIDSLKLILNTGSCVSTLLFVFLSKHEDVGSLAFGRDVTSGFDLVCGQVSVHILLRIWTDVLFFPALSLSNNLSA